MSVLPLENYTATFDTDTYHYRLVHPITQKVKLGNYTSEQLIRANSFFRAHNAQGFNIYCRPVGYQFVLLDDLTRDVLADVAKLKPCMLMETSPANYQAWLILPEIPANRDTAKAICRELAMMFGADLASAEPDHVGRLPGFTNRKEKHRMANGKYPPVELHRFEKRVSSFYPSGGASAFSSPVSATIGTRPGHRSNGENVSEQDFGKVCWLIRQGRSDEQIYQYLLDNSPNLLKRKKGKHLDHYLRLTINNAHKAVG